MPQDKILKKYKKLFEAFELYDKGLYKRSFLVDTKPKNKRKNK